MKTGDKITLSNGEQAIVVSGDINLYKYALGMHFFAKWDLQMMRKDVLHE
ncbi:hypothetical protein NE302_12820 [Lactococcus lactis]|nr:hypothetical protein [Lactococcus lactis]MCM6852445.1 hypothetical protein [Lactococcus lactis]